MLFAGAPGWDGPDTDSDGYADYPDVGAICWFDWSDSSFTSACSWDNTSNIGDRFGSSVVTGDLNPNNNYGVTDAKYGPLPEVAVGATGFDGYTGMRPGRPGTR